MNVTTDFNLDYALSLLINNRAVLLDVRTYQEFCQGHLKGALLVPTQLPPLTDRERANLKEQMRYTLRHIPKNIPIIIYCKKGVRAKIAKELVQELGYTHAVALGGVEEPPLRTVFTGQNPMWPICYCQH